MPDGSATLRRRGAATFKQRDVECAIKAARLAGMSPTRVEIDRDGKIVLVFSGEQISEDDGGWGAAHEAAT